MEIFRNVNIQGYERNTGVYGGTAVCCSFMYVLINFFYDFPLGFSFRIFLGLSTKNNPKKHMGKEDETKEVEKEVFFLQNTKGLLTVILKDSLCNTKGLLTVILKDSLLLYIRSSC